MTLPPRPKDGFLANAARATAGPDETPVYLDLLRADLYRLLDELVRARPEDHRGLVLEFEAAWEQFKDATAREA
jgi:hypothetical protein